MRLDPIGVFTVALCTAVGGGAIAGFDPAVVATAHMVKNFMYLVGLFGSFVLLAALSVLTRLLIYLVCIAALPRLRSSAIGPADAMRLPAGMLNPGLAAVVCVGLLTQVSYQSVIATAALLAVGSLLYLAARRFR